MYLSQKVVCDPYMHNEGNTNFSGLVDFTTSHLFFLISSPCGGLEMMGLP